MNRATIPTIPGTTMDPTAPPTGPTSGPMPPRPPAEAGAGKEPQRDIAAEIEAMIPDPKRDGYSPKVLAQVEEALREVWPLIAGLPPIPDAHLVTGDGKGKLPMSLMAPVVALLAAAVEAGGTRYDLDLADLVDDSALHKVAAMLQALKKDKKILAALSPEPDADDAGGMSDGDADNAAATSAPPKMPKAVQGMGAA